MSPECTRNLLICFLWLIKNTGREKLKSWWLSLPPHQLVGILDLLYISVSCFEYGTKVICRLLMSDCFAHSYSL